MALFRRGRKPREEDVSSQDEAEETSASADGDADDVSDESDETRSGRGPLDASDVDGLGSRIDLGALWVTPRAGIALRLDVEPGGKRIVAATVTLAGSALQLQAFAAPKTSGIWDDIREEIASSVTKEGGTVDDVPGPYGRELLARMPARTAGGRTGHRPVRFLGVDGPRWFLRGVITGPAAVDAKAAEPLEEIFGECVVVRGTEARPPRELLTLTVPEKTDSPVAEAPTTTLDPFERGPEITEIQ